MAKTTINGKMYNILVRANIYYYNLRGQYLRSNSIEVHTYHGNIMKVRARLRRRIPLVKVNNIVRRKTVINHYG